MKAVFRIFGKGLLVVLPFIVLIWILTFIFNIFQGIFTWFLNLLQTNLSFQNSIWITIITTILVVLFIIWIGFTYERKQRSIFVAIGEYVVQKIPFAGSIYTTVKDVILMLGGGSKDKYLGVALVSFGDGDLIGLITSKEGEYYFVFVTFAPPTSGLLVRIHEDKIKKADMSVGDALKKIVSLGMK